MARTKTFTCRYCTKSGKGPKAYYCFLCDAGPYHEACYLTHRAHCG